MATATGTATDPLGLNDDATLTVSTGGATGIRTVSTSLHATRINFGSVVDTSTNGPDLVLSDFYAAPTGPVTLGISMRLLIDARITGIRLYKAPAATGTIPVGMWSNAGTLLATKTVTWVSDAGGWVTVPFDTAVEVDAGATYHWGYLWPNANSLHAKSPWVWNGQDTCVYPFVLPTFSQTGAGVKSNGSWWRAGATLTLGSLPADRYPHNFYVDPVVEWDLDIPGYTSGESYYDQFPNGGSRFAFPVGVYFSDPEFLAGYKAIGVNTQWNGSVSDAYVEAVIAADMDWHPTLHGNDMSAPIAVQEDASLAACVRGYLLTDEPELVTPHNPPDTLRTWRNNARRIDSTRPIHLNMSRIVAKNQGFDWQPVGIGAEDVNLEWREYMSLVDTGSLDCYAIARTDPFAYASGSNRYGIWIYPLVIDRMRREVTDERVPILGIIETTSAYEDEPTPTQVARAVWATLIAGARGIMYFDHRFASPEVTQDFAAMLTDAPMSAAISALNAQMQTLAGPLWATDSDLIDSYTSTGTLTSAQGGYAAGASIPLHYTSRLYGGSTYLFVQTIRDGTTTATLFAPSLAGATLTVIGESRTVTVDGSGYFTDTFTGDYAYHLYSTTTDPSFSAPVNTVAPAITDDGSPRVGETVTCSTGTWTGIPTPAFAYRWRTATGAGAYSDIAGATSSSYALVTGDAGNHIRCRVTATNSQGTATADSDIIDPDVAAGSGYATAVLADAPEAYYQLSDLTDSSGNGHTLTASSGTVSLTAASLVGDSADKSAEFVTATETLSVADTAALRLTSTWSGELWVNSDGSAGAANLVGKTGHYRFQLRDTGKARFTAYTTGGYWEATSTTTLSTSGTYHLVGTWNGAVAKLYVNGVLDASFDATAFSPGSPNGTTSELAIGKDPNFAEIGFFSRIDEVAIYNDVVLDATQVAAHYTAGTP